MNALRFDYFVNVHPADMLTWAETVAVHFTPKINNYVFLCSCHRNNQAEEDFPHNMTDNLVGEGFAQVLSIH